MGGWLRRRGIGFPVLIVATLIGCTTHRAPDLSAPRYAIAGRVFARGETSGLPDAEVRVDGTDLLTRTDSTGRFALDIPHGVHLVVDRPGFKKQRFSPGTARSLNIVMVPDPNDERIQVGYGTQRKANVTGSVATVKDEDFGTGTAHTIEEVLQGRVPGVTVYYTPTGRMGIRIRGTNSISGSNAPLYVIDGFPMEADPEGGLSGLNTRDIESIQILKDASATAIYGTRGANGVILIQTKKNQ